MVEGAADTRGFTTEVVRDQTKRVATLSWQGGSVPPGGLALFQFSASVPDTTGEVRLTATQTFADGSTKVWTSPVITVAKPDSAGGSDTTARLLAALALALAASAIAISPDRDAAALKRLSRSCWRCWRCPRLAPAHGMGARHAASHLARLPARGSPRRRAS